MCGGVCGGVGIELSGVYILLYECGGGVCGGVCVGVELSGVYTLLYCCGEEYVLLYGVCGLGV